MRILYVAKTEQRNTPKINCQNSGRKYIKNYSTMSDESDRKESSVPMDADNADGEQEEYVKLVSAEGHEFILPRRIALVSKTMRAMLEGNFREAEDAVVQFPDLSAHVLEKVIQYLHYYVRYNNSTSRIPEFKIEPEISLELMVAANYLHC